MCAHKFHIDRILCILTLCLGFLVLNCEEIPDVPVEEAPVPDINPSDIDASVGEFVELDGSSSTDPDGDYPLVYYWSFDQIPVQSALDDASFSRNGTVTTSFMPDVVGIYVIRLGVVDSQMSASNGYAYAVVTVVENQPPVVTAINWDPTSPEVGNDIRLSCEVYDPDNDLIAYEWEFVSKPVGSIAELLDNNLPSPYFEADIERWSPKTGQ